MYIFFLILLFVPDFTYGSKVYIPVGEARVKRSILAFPDPIAGVGSNPNQAEFKKTLRTLKDIITHDLDFTNLFSFQSEDAFLEPLGTAIQIDSFQMQNWITIGTEFLIKSQLTITQTLAYEVRLYDVLGKKQILGKRYTGKTADLNKLAHTVSSDLVEALTGKKGVFFTNLVMVCDKSGKKELWVTDFDGRNPKQVTHHHSLAFSPAWSIDNKKIAYSLYTKNKNNIKNIDLYELDLNKNQSRLLSNRPGINSGATYAPNGNHLALTMSFLGNPEIFMLDLAGNKVTRLSKSLGVDVDPAWSPDGKKLAFVSSRSGQPMVYVANADGSQATRVTFAGQYNATPRWNDTGKKIVFAGYIDGRFDLFLMNVDGTSLERLTKNEGSNEDPDFSPDGNHIVFSSNRTGQKNIYIISIDGMLTRRLTYGLGNCEAPRWGHY